MDREILEMAKQGALLMIDRCNLQLAALNAPSVRAARTPPVAQDEAQKPGRKKRTMSAAGRARIAEAQRARWASRDKATGKATGKAKKAAEATA